ncbi:MAG: SDR family oxidoreductase [Bacteroidetes bacterium]|nr:SDR family oxidoreductase [Bacteroidota bacterium]
MKKQTILITGGAKRIGAAIVKHFAKNDCNIIINYLNSEKEVVQLAEHIKKNDVNPIPYKTDVTNVGEVANMFMYAKKEFGGVDILINNAGIFPPKQPLEKLKYSDYFSTLNLNMNAAIITAKELVNSGVSNARIINIGSIGGTKIFKNNIDYNLSKTGLIRLTQILAKELSPSISVNCICPGIVQIDNENINFPLKNIPMQRFAKTDDIIAAVDFFANGPSYITGQVLHISGGMEL